MNNSSDTSTLNSELSGRDFYANLYSDSLEYEAEWLRRRAVQTADSICTLIHRQGLNPSNILEVGCGTGAVLYELQKRGIAKSYYAIDYSSDAISYVNHNLPDVHAIVGDIKDCPQLFQGKKFDLVICAHVLEHLEVPQLFLKSIGHLNWQTFIAEVPLENLFFGKIKERFQDRTKHPAGHVQFFNKNQFLDLIAGNELNIINQNIYAPILTMDTLKFRYGNSSRFKYIYKIFTENYFPRFLGSFWTKYYHAHMAVICDRKKLNQ